MAGNYNMNILYNEKSKDIDMIELSDEELYLCTRNYLLISP